MRPGEEQGVVLPCIPPPDEFGEHGQELVLRASGRTDADCGRVVRLSAPLTQVVIEPFRGLLGAVSVAPE
ncbi:hypothetical protein ACIQM3_20575 [Streptomyces sp. NPDC091271]|uniref:hypothetical protein n=1 Tax=Streptomyces sp. NPDC091271 TaxID=3365980 RepID=UPI0037F554D7